MIYRDFKGEKLSALGLGTMRMPVVDGKSRRQFRKDDRQNTR